LNRKLSYRENLINDIVSHVKERYGIEITEQDVINEIDNYSKFIRHCFIQKHSIRVPYIGVFALNKNKEEIKDDTEFLKECGFNKDEINMYLYSKRMERREQYKIAKRNETMDSNK
jgi:nucleoid DNA-binding protein